MTQLCQTYLNIRCWCSDMSWVMARYRDSKFIVHDQVASISNLFDKGMNLLDLSK